MSNPATAAFLPTMAATPEVYIEANHFTSTFKTPELGPAGEPNRDGHESSKPQPLEPIRNRPPRRVWLRTTWDDRVNFQRIRNSQLSDYGQSTIDDQGIRFEG
jgi:hypothetical protein